MSKHDTESSSHSLGRDAVAGQEVALLHLDNFLVFLKAGGAESELELNSAPEIDSELVCGAPRSQLRFWDELSAPFQRCFIQWFLPPCRAVKLGTPVVHVMIDPQAGLVQVPVVPNRAHSGRPRCAWAADARLRRPGTKDLLSHLDGGR
eukprot:7101807-Pyramimonas_sp.AAC.1